MTVTERELREVYSPGALATGVLRVASDVAHGETVTIGSDTFAFRNNTTMVAGTISVYLASTLTPANATTKLAAAITANSILTVAEKISDNELLVTSREPAPMAITLSETMAGANNAWDHTATANGQRPGPLKTTVFTRAPDATEVALGTMHFAVPFAPTAAIAQVKVTATGALKAWDGDVLLNTDANEYRVTINNDGSTDWAATDTVTVVVHG